MKIKLLVILLSFCATLTACNKEHENQIYEPTDGHRVEVQISHGGAATRGFYDENAGAEPWEKKINTLSILVFDQSGNLQYQHDLSPTEITSDKLEMLLPKTFGGKSYTFYAIANYPMPANQCKTISQLEAKTDQSIFSHNGEFAEIVSRGHNPAGFPMSGKCDATVSSTYITTLHFLMKRTVSKIAIRTTLSPAFLAKYGKGELKIFSAAISKSATLSTLVPVTGGDYGILDRSFGQHSHSTKYGEYDNLFYTFGNPKLGDKRVTIELDGVFDRDGNWSTTQDQIHVPYSAPLNDSQEGEILRNHYYRIGIQINGLSRADTGLTSFISDWNYPHNVNNGFDY